MIFFLLIYLILIIFVLNYLILIIFDKICMGKTFLLT
jgi:hypothetical protein